MNPRAHTLAEQFERANNEAIVMVERCSDAQWRLRCEAEGWPVGVTARHIASSHDLIAGWVERVAAGESPADFDTEAVHRLNAQHALDYATCTKGEVLDLLRNKGATAAALVRGLDDEQLDRTAALPSGHVMSAHQLVERILIGHVRGHLESIRAALGGA